MPIDETNAIKLSREYKTAGLKEDIVYGEIVKPFIDGVSDCVMRNIAYSFMEMLNNAIDHSGGDTVQIALWKTEKAIGYSIHDNGIGVFQKVSEALSLSKPAHAVIELVKGKFTTDPKNHSGEGFFFSSKCGDGFAAAANGIQYIADDKLEIISTGVNMSDNSQGTTIYFSISLDNSKKIKDLFDEYTDAPDDYSFSKTRIPIELLEYGDANPVYMSRSQARRLLARVEQFDTVTMDFTGVDEIGQAFADEIFRVFSSEHHNLKIIATNCNEDVTRMIMRASRH